MKKGRNLLDKSKLLSVHPELRELFYSTAAYHGKIIFSKRMELNLTQSELAEKAGVSIKTIARAEGRTGNLTTETMDKIFHAVGLSPKEVATLVLELSHDEEAATLVTV